MSRVSQVLVAAVCFIAACLSDPVPEVAPLNGRNVAAVNTYYITTAAFMGTNMDHSPIDNTVAGVQLLTYLNDTVPITILVHGRDSSAYSPFANELRNIIALQDRTCAVIVVDWSAIAGGNYAQARAMVPQVAQNLIDFIALMDDEDKLNRDLLHLVGFDLGAHVVGIASRNEDARARKITALSPAGESWEYGSNRLRSTDADFVEVIHTDAVGSGAFGIVGDALGTIDFYPSGGTRQPGCSNRDNECHHNRAWQLFGATVQNRHLFGNRCDTLAQALNNRCTGAPQVIMGTSDRTKPAQGRWYALSTQRTYPY